MKYLRELIAHTVRNKSQKLIISTFHEQSILTKVSVFREQVLKAYIHGGIHKPPNFLEVLMGTTLSIFEVVQNLCLEILSSNTEISVKRLEPSVKRGYLQ